MDKCKLHPKYKGILQPRVVCPVCWAIYRERVHMNEVRKHGAGQLDADEYYTATED